MTENVEKLKEHLTQWEPFRDMWEVNKDQFIAQYEKNNAPISTFDADIGKWVWVKKKTCLLKFKILLIIYIFIFDRYSTTANNVQLLETISPVHFLLINSTALKQAISDHCAMFSTIVSNLLRKLAFEKINNIFQYTSENGTKWVSPVKCFVFVVIYFRLPCNCYLLCFKDN